MEDRDRFYKQVGQKIRDARGKDLSQQALAAAVGLTRTSISNIEKGRQRMLLHTLVDLAIALKVDPAKLLPDKNMPVEAGGIAALEHLPAKERVFIESAIGIARQGENDHGSKTTENSGFSGGPSQEERGRSAARPGLGNRAQERSNTRS